MKNPASWHWGMRQQTVYDLAEKHAFSLDLIENNLVGRDLAYELTEIDTSWEPLQRPTISLLKILRL